MKSSKKFVLIGEIVSRFGALKNLDKKDIYEPHHEVEWARRMRELGYDGELFLLFEEGRGGLYGQEAAGEVDT